MQANKRILIVGNDYKLQKVLEDRLTDYCYDVFSVEDRGEELA